MPGLSSPMGNHQQAQRAQREQGWTRVLEWLFREGPLTAEELMGRTGLGRSALYGRLRECRRSGWVKPSEKLITSRRDSYIITDTGARLLKPVPGGGMVMVISEVTPPTDPRYA